MLGNDNDFMFFLVIKLLEHYMEQFVRHGKEKEFLDQLVTEYKMDAENKVNSIKDIKEENKENILKVVSEICEANRKQLYKFFNILDVEE